jgi:histidinol phosphatase-like PHP family hydrolase
MGISIAINTDSHDKETLDGNEVWSMGSKARMAWKKDIINTLPLTNLLRLLNRKKL